MSRQAKEDVMNDARCDCDGWMTDCSCDFIPEARVTSEFARGYSAGFTAAATADGEPASMSRDRAEIREAFVQLVREEYPNAGDNIIGLFDAALAATPEHRTIGEQAIPRCPLCAADLGPIAVEVMRRWDALVHPIRERTYVAVGGEEHDQKIYEHLWDEHGCRHDDNEILGK